MKALILLNTLCVVVLSLDENQGMAKARTKRYCITCGCCWQNAPRMHSVPRIEYENPCASGSPLFAPNQPIYCDWQRSDACPPNFGCHVGATVATTTCCPLSYGDSGPCDAPLVTGQGYSNLPRWFYDRQRNICSQFTYLGLKGNSNNFMTQFQCESTCLKKTSTNPCLIVNFNKQICGMCSETVNACANGFYCHIGATKETTTCCPKTSESACQLDLLIGEGDDKVRRWFYKSQSSSCEQFTYFGSKGNENNFISQAACEEACSVNKKRALCPGESTPGATSTMEKQRCSSNVDCRNGFWCCTVSSNENVCCPRTGVQSCSISYDVGTGSLSLPRWFFDLSSRECRKFLYSGQMGNENNFRSQEQCHSECRDFINPCAESLPAVDFFKKTLLKCTSNEGCPLGYYCHIGQDAQNQVCCYSSKETCHFLVSTGQGDAALIRWYFDMERQQCSTFFYKGSKGNANNFISRQDCLNSCSKHFLCPNGDTPYFDYSSNKLVNCHFSRSVCPVESHFCSVGFDEQSTVCCPKRGNACHQSIVGQPLFGGARDSRVILRYFYDSSDNQCRQFRYQGYGGNENNFLSKGECEESCRRYRYHCPHGEPLTGSFGDLIKCRVNSSCPMSHVCHVTTDTSISVCCPNPEQFCSLPTEFGSCNLKQIRYHYSPSLNNCVQFAYGGCGGNLNNFESLETCKQICCIRSKKK